MSDDETKASVRLIQEGSNGRQPESGSSMSEVL